MRPASQRTQRMKLPRMMIPGTRERRAARTRMRTRKERARAEDVTMKGKTLVYVLVMLPLKEEEEGGYGLGVMGLKKVYDTYQGVPSDIWVCTTMNHEKIPRHVADAARTTRSHMLSWISGQWYFRP
jgi:hypothetical protein